MIYFLLFSVRKLNVLLKKCIYNRFDMMWFKIGGDVFELDKWKYD